jgi:hypothetical protein
MYLFYGRIDLGFSKALLAYLRGPVDIPLGVSEEFSCSPLCNMLLESYILSGPQHQWSGG